MIPSLLSLSESDWSNYPGYQFMQEILANKYRHMRGYEWQTLAPKPLDQLGEPLALVRESDGDEQALFSFQSGLLKMTVSRERVRVAIVSDSMEEIEAEVARWRVLMPLAEKPDTTAITFWYLTNHGPANIRRLISVPEWPDIASNYGGDIGAQLTDMMSFRPSAAGQLLLWQGNPGTGKTYALRALARAWQPWCDVHYVTDPDNFFGTSVSYLMSTIFSNQDDDDEPTVVTPGQPTPAHAGPRWRLVVLEDAGELLMPDARAQVGQALSRLLNLVDGMLGQGLRVLVLITTNEPLGKLHPAVARPGRCAARIEFKALSRADARAWLTSRGGDPNDVSKDTTIAELYAHLNGHQQKPAPEEIGIRGELVETK